ncbi:MAG: HD-GYP domain-containing protein [Anaerolineales bacterium]
MEEANQELHDQLPINQLSALLKVSNALASSLEPQEILQIAINSVIELLNIETGAIYTLEEENLFLGATTPPLPVDFPEVLRFANLNDHPHLRQAIQQKKHVYLRNARDEELSPEEQIVVDSRSLVSILYFPLLLKDQPIGAFIIGTTADVREFDECEIDLCKILSSQASYAIANAKLYKETQQALFSLTRAYDETLAGWSRMIDLRDHVTDAHTRRVTNLTINLARRMGIPEKDLDHIQKGALLHDIGKIGISDAILQKPGALTDDEWEIMRSHPGIAYEILSEIDYLKPALEIPYCHHEKWNGTGYPRKLKGKEIPLAARIFAIIDVYDALTSDRPYRKAWSHQKALDYIKGQSGEYFSPAVVDEFLEMLEDLGILD